jgi:hypothetical protein
MTFNLKLIPLLSKTVLEKAEKDLVKAIKPIANKIVNEYKRMGSLFGDQIQSPIFALIPKKKSEYLHNVKVRDAVDFMMEQTRNNPELRDWIGLFAASEFDKQSIRFPVKKLNAKYVWHAMGFIKNGSSGLTTLNKLKDLKQYRFVERGFYLSYGYRLALDDHFNAGAVVFGALNPLHFLSPVLLEKLKTLK